jgi:hypothetical protein
MLQSWQTSNYPQRGALSGRSTMPTTEDAAQRLFAVDSKRNETHPVRWP